MKVYFTNPEYGAGLNIYFMSDDGTAIHRFVGDAGGSVVVTEEEVPEGVMVRPTLALGYPFADAFIEGFKKFLGTQADTPTSVPLHIWAREADRVDRLIDFAITPAPVMRDQAEYFPSRDG